LRKGDPVIVYPWIGCGECRKCLSGTENLCEGRAGSLGVFRDGGYAEFAIVPDGKYAVQSQGIEPGMGATLSCSGLTTHSALRKSRIMSDELLVIIGAGGLGTMCIQLAKKISGAKVAVLDVATPKLEMAKNLGADFTIDTSRMSKSEVVQKLRDNNSGRGADAVVDFVGSNETASLGFDLLGKAGRLVLVGLFGGAAQFPLPTFPVKGVEVIGVYTGTLRDMAEVIDLTKRGVIAPVIGGKYELSKANEALESLRRKEILGRAVLTAD
jgi:propanol-preferring alcohol dehydrogenase